MKSLTTKTLRTTKPPQWKVRDCPEQSNTCLARKDKYIINPLIIKEKKYGNN